MDEAEVQQLARTFIAGIDTSSIRNDLSAYLNAANAKVRKEDLKEGESGYTITKSSGLHVITVNSSETDERQRFTICHEIAHIVLKLPSEHMEIPSWSFAKRHLNEVACDIFAAELLMPYKMWRDKVPAGNPSAAVIDHMTREFGVSYPAAASRYATLASFPCAFVTMERGIVRYAARSTLLRRARAWITPKSPIPTGSVAHRLRTSSSSDIETDDVAQDIWFENWEKGLDLSEIARHYARFDTTVSLIWFSEEELPEVERDRFGTIVTEDEGLTELTGELPWPGKSRRR